MRELKVLLVDDDSAVRAALKRILRSLACAVVEADNGAAALEELAKASYSFLVLDINMPVLNGVEVLQAVRQSTEFGSLPVVMISGNGDGSTVSEVVRLGISDFLAKPFKMDQAKMRLLRMVQAVRREDAGGAPAAYVPHGSNSVLVVDGNSEFRYFVSNCLTASRPTIEATTGLQGLEICVTRKPGIVLIGSGLGILGHAVLANRLRRDPDLADTRIVRVVDEAADAQKNEQGLFDGFITRTFVADAFVEQFDRLFAHTLSDQTGALAIVRRTVGVATQQALGMMAHTDVALVSTPPAASPASEIVASVVLHLASEKSEVHMAVYSDTSSAKRIASRLLGLPEEEVADEDAMSAMGEVINVIAGRVQGAVAADGCPARFTLPDIAMSDHASPRPEPELTLHFAPSTNDLRFRLCLTMTKAMRSTVAA